jgi:hypothetical protein
MHKDTIATPLEPFTAEEESALFGKLDSLSIPELENYIGLAQNSLRNKGLEPTWRPRVAIGLQRAEIVLVREAAAQALRAEAPPPEVPAPTKAKAKSKKKAATVVAETTESAEPDAESEASEEAE